MLIMFGIYYHLNIYYRVTIPHKIICLSKTFETYQSLALGYTGYDVNSGMLRICIVQGLGGSLLETKWGGGNRKTEQNLLFSSLLRLPPTKTTNPSMLCSIVGWTLHAGTCWLSGLQRHFGSEGHALQCN